VSISEDQRKPLAAANWLATVPHGIPAGQFTLQPHAAPDRYLAFLGRMAPEKAPDVAIKLALRAGLPIKLAAKVDSADRAYFEQVVKPLLSHPQVEFLGEVGEQDKQVLLGGALALLFPIAWPEPFGVVMIEAMACGTPVVAYNCGSVPEIVQPGVTGFIVESEEDAMSAIARLDTLDRRAVRATFDRLFTAEAMARAYVDSYASLLESHRLGRVS
jgi:glycosyltransferase involved in cell wall biosynthesis